MARKYLSLFFQEISSPSQSEISSPETTQSVTEVSYESDSSCYSSPSTPMAPSTPSSSTPSTSSTPKFSKKVS